MVTSVIDTRVVDGCTIRIDRTCIKTSFGVVLPSRRHAALKSLSSIRAALEEHRLLRSEGRVRLARDSMIIVNRSAVLRRHHAILSAFYAGEGANATASALMTSEAAELVVTPAGMTNGYLLYFFPSASKYLLVFLGRPYLGSGRAVMDMLFSVSGWNWLSPTHPGLSRKYETQNHPRSHATWQCHLPPPRRQR